MLEISCTGSYGIPADNLSYVDVVPDSVKKNIIVGWLISRTPDRDFFGFTYEIILSHIPVLAHGKDKNEQLHIDLTLAACPSVMSL